MIVKNNIAYFDPECDGKTLFFPKEATGAVFDADCVNRLIASGFEHIEIEDGNPFFKLRNGCLIDGNGNLVLAQKGVVIPNDGTVKRICDFSFPCYEKRDILYIPEGVEEIGLDVFRGKIKKVYLPSSLKVIREGAFRHSLEINEIVIDENNQYFYIEKNCLIDKANNTLLYAIGDIIDIPYGGKRIGRLVFLDHRFKKIIIPASVKEIAEQNFFFVNSHRHKQVPSYLLATHAKLYVKGGSYAERYFIERGLCADTEFIYSYAYKVIK